MELTDLGAQFNEEEIITREEEKTSTPVKSPQTGTSLTATWSICTSDSGFDYSPAKTTLSHVPEPPPAVLDMMNLLCKREVQDYLRKFNHYFKQQPARTFLRNEIQRNEFENQDKQQDRPLILQYPEWPGDTSNTYLTEELDSYIPPTQNLHTSSLHQSLPVMAPQHTEQLNTTMHQAMPQQLETPTKTHQAMPQTLDTSTQIHQAKPQEMDTSMQMHQANHQEMRTPTQMHQTIPQQLDTSTEIHQAMPQQMDTCTQMHQAMPQQLNTSMQMHQVMPQQLNTSTHMHQAMPQQLNTSTHMHQAMPQQLNTSMQMHQAMPQQLNTSTHMHQAMPQQLNTSTHMHQAMPQQLNTSMQMQQITPVPDFSPRRSPRKHKTTQNDQEYVKLLESSEMRVPKAKLRKATTAASHYEGGKAAYTLTSKLAVLIFSTEELAQSRGQGIRDAKKGDIRPVLDHDKLDVLKEYVNTWCQKNGKGKMEDKFFNDAVTERISYSRKLMKKIQKK